MTRTPLPLQSGQGAGPSLVASGRETRLHLRREGERRLADAKGPLDMIPRALARSLAMDELDMAYVVQKSCVAQAEPVRAGHFVDLDGRSYFISNRGEVESEGERGTFAAYVTN